MPPNPIMLSGRCHCLTLITVHIQRMGKRLFSHVRLSINRKGVPYGILSLVLFGGILVRSVIRRGYSQRGYAAGGMPLVVFRRRNFLFKVNPSAKK